jgi:hypothetical protein
VPLLDANDAASQEQKRRLGVFRTMPYNPLAMTSKERARVLEIAKTISDEELLRRRSIAVPYPGVGHVKNPRGKS